KLSTVNFPTFNFPSGPKTKGPEVLKGFRAGCARNLFVDVYRSIHRDTARCAEAFSPMQQHAQVLTTVTKPKLFHAQPGVSSRMASADARSHRAHTKAGAAQLALADRVRFRSRPEVSGPRARRY